MGLEPIGQGVSGEASTSKGEGEPIGGPVDERSSGDTSRAAAPGESARGSPRATAPRPRRALLARALLLAASLPITLLAGLGGVAHPTSYAWSDPTLYAVPGAAMVLSLLGFVASFAPFDRPQSTPRWTRPLVGFLVAAAVTGLAAFTSSFLVLGPCFLLLALLLHLGGRAVAAGPPDLELPTTSLSPEELAELADPPLDWRVWAPIAVGAVLGLTLTLLWRPIAGDLPVRKPAEGIAAVISREVEREPRPRGRVIHNGRSIEVNGNDLRLHLSLDRPRILLRLRDQSLVIEPCLLIEEGSVDGFPVIWDLNGIRLEPGGMAHTAMAEGRSRAWIRADYPRGRAKRGALATRTGFLGRRAGPSSISATIELEVDLDWGRVVIDARTRLARPGAARRATLGWIRLDHAPALATRVGLGEGLDYVALEAEREARDGLRFFACGPDQVRLVKAKRGSSGPYETLAMGPFRDWLVLRSRHTETLVVAPDWRRLASRRISRTAGFGLPENSLRLWREGEGLNVAFDVASGRHGAGVLLSELPTGLYRNRIVIHPLRREAPEAVAGEVLARFAQAEASGTRIELGVREDLGPAIDRNPVEGPDSFPPR